MKERQKQAKALKESRKLEVNLSVNKQTVIHETAMHAFFYYSRKQGRALVPRKEVARSKSWSEIMLWNKKLLFLICKVFESFWHLTSDLWQ